MSRKSTAALAVAPVSIAERPKPPRRLRAAEKRIWKEVVARMPGNWFTAETLQVLRSYCIHCVRAEMMDRNLAIAEEEADGSVSALLELDQLWRASVREANLIYAAATKMRITPKSRYTEKTAATAIKHAASKKPWER